MTKLIRLFGLAILMMACDNKKNNNYVKITGTITNPISDSIVLFSKGIDDRVFNLNKDGSFLIDSLKLKESSMYLLIHGEKYISLFLKNGYDLKLEWDGAENTTLIGEGEGTKENKHHIETRPIVTETIMKAMRSMDIDSTSYNKLLNKNAETLIGLLESKKDLDSSFINYERKRFLFYKRNHLSRYKNINSIKILNNTSAPEFIDFENYTGGKTSLSDLKGKFVFIDVWATWCGPCLKEIPYLKELEKKYHDKNIQFVSISIDKKEDHDTWKNMVTDLELIGMQLYANEDQKFLKGYAISGIPRFILINPEGLIISAQTPKPSDEKLIDLFNDVGI